MKTATVERRHVYGTPRYQLIMHYRGNIVRWWHNGASVHAIVQDDASYMNIGNGLPRLPADLTYLHGYAKAQGFTHVKFTGDWTGRTQPANFKL